MIITNVIGGLGNQMFQYAMGRALTERHGVPLRLDTSGFTRYDRHHGYELSKVFPGIQAEEASGNDFRSVLGWRGSDLARRMLKRPLFRVCRGRRFVLEPTFDYWSDVVQLPDSCYLAGYWQSERYFAECADALRREFSFRASVDPTCERWAARIAATESVSLHVRRGDYAHDATTQSRHGLCSLTYYQHAVAHLLARVPNATFYVFSDDIPWARDHISLGGRTKFPDVACGSQSSRDMELMSRCRHNIVANSSFSWWAAWLNPSSEKIVVAPQKWLADRPNYSPVPEGWVKL